MSFSLDALYPNVPGLQEWWNTNFPNWPESLTEKYAQAIAIDAWHFGFQPASNPDFTGFQNWWQSVIAPPAQANYRYDWPYGYSSNVNFGFSLLNPQNGKYLVTGRWDISFWFGQKLALGWFSPSPPESIQTNMNQTMQGLIGIGLHVFMNYDSRLYQSNFQWNYATIGSLVGSHSEFNGMFDVVYGDYYSYLIVAPNASATPYDGVNTILALHENGADNPGVNYGLMYEYKTYRDAYLAYGAQIQANLSVDAQRSKQAVLDYQNNLADKLQQQKNALQNLQFTTKQNLNAELASAQRDMTNTILNAQNLKLNLLAALKNG